MSEVECNCYPGGFSPDTYEGPQHHCPVHGHGTDLPVSECPQCQADRLPRLIPSWVFTVPAEEPEEAEGVDLVAALKGAIQRARDLRKSDFTLSPPTEDPAEPRYMETLDADERGGH